MLGRYRWAVMVYTRNNLLPLVSARVFAPSKDEGVLFNSQDEYVGDRNEIFRISLQAVLAGGLGFLMMWIIGPMMEDIERNREKQQKLEVLVGKLKVKVEHLEKEK